MAAAALPAPCDAALYGCVEENGSAMRLARLMLPKLISRKPPASEKFFRKSQNRPRPLLSLPAQKSPGAQKRFHSSAVTMQ